MLIYSYKQENKKFLRKSKVQCRNIYVGDVGGTNVMKTISEMNKEELAMKFASEVVTEEQLEEIKNNDNVLRVEYDDYTEDYIVVLIGTFFTVELEER